MLDIPGLTVKHTKALLEMHETSKTLMQMKPFVIQPSNVELFHKGLRGIWTSTVMAFPDFFMFNLFALRPLN